jgi:hypothetical protein
MCCHRVWRSSGLQCNERTRNAFEREWQLVPDLARGGRMPDLAIALCSSINNFWIQRISGQTAHILIEQQKLNRPLRCCDIFSTRYSMTRCCEKVIYHQSFFLPCFSNASALFLASAPLVSEVRRSIQYKVYFTSRGRTRKWQKK